MPEPIEVRKVPIHNVSDASGLADLIDSGVLDADRVVAVIGKTEGNGGVNDYTRIIADRAFREVLVDKGSRTVEEVKQVPIVWSGGTDGILSPHATIFATVPADDVEVSDEPRLTVGFAMSEVLMPEDIGRTAMVTKVADAVREAMQRAGITDVADVHYVQTKTPLLTIHTIRDAKSRGETVWTEHTHESMDLSNGCTALGVAVGLGEIDMPRDEDVMHDRSLFSAVASCSSGVELDRAQVVVVGNARGVGGRYRIGHSVMRDALDADGIWTAIADAGLELPERPSSADLRGRLVNVFLKCEVSQDGQVLGRRNAMLDDSDVHWHRQIKAAVGGVTAAVTGDPAVFVSVSAAHQGPDGGGDRGPRRATHRLRPTAPLMRRRGVRCPCSRSCSRRAWRPRARLQAGRTTGCGCPRRRSARLRVFRRAPAPRGPHRSRRRSAARSSARRPATRVREQAAHRP
jgi:barbiturase